MSPLDEIGAMPGPEFAHLGVEYLAYVKRIVINDTEIVYAIHAADGTALGITRDRDTAMASVRQHGLEPVSVQ
jgi:hypothetical protein